MLTDHYIVYTDATRFSYFVTSAGIEEIENFLLDCDDLINEICDKHGGIIRQVNGDEYFFTFTDAIQTINAIQELCHSWKRIVVKHGLGITIGVHKGNLNVFHSFIYGDDIHTTVYLTQLDRLYFPRKDEIHAIFSRKVRDEFQSKNWKGKFLALDENKIVEEVQKGHIREQGAFEFIYGDPENDSLSAPLSL